MNLGRYRKLIAAVVGLIAVIVGPDVLELTDNTEQLVQGIMALLTAIGVYEVRNDA